jgi:hypothetical protein
MFDHFDFHRRNRRRFLGIAAITLGCAPFGVIGIARAQAGQTVPADPRAIRVHPMLNA